jgi:long-chain fatty acid transport protein
MEVELIRVINLAGNKATIKGDDVSLGFNAGVLYKPTPKTQVGLHYRSGIDHKLEGTVQSDLALPTLNTNVTADANLPANLSLSVGHKVNGKLEVMGDVTHTKWSSYERIKVVRADGSVLTDDLQGWKDSNRYAIGANYQYNDRLKLRGGIAYDETPVPNAQLRSPRTPDNDRTWVALGANYKIKKNLDMDVAYTHIFMKNTPIENANASDFLLKGSYENKVDVVGAQLNWSF